MTLPEWIDRDHLRIPSPAIADGVQGDGVRIIEPDDPAWEVWEAHMAHRGMERPGS